MIQSFLNFKFDPVYLLEFLVSIESSHMKTEQPSVYTNILAIGLSQVGKVSIALDQIELILATKLSTDEESLDGKIFLKTVCLL